MKLLGKTSHSRAIIVRRRPGIRESDKIGRVRTGSPDDRTSLAFATRTQVIVCMCHAGSPFAKPRSNVPAGPRCRVGARGEMGCRACRVLRLPRRNQGRDKARLATQDDPCPAPGKAPRRLQRILQARRAARGRCANPIILITPSRAKATLTSAPARPRGETGQTEEETRTGPSPETPMEGAPSHAGQQPTQTFIHDPVERPGDYERLLGTRRR